MNAGPSYQKAVALRTARVVYCRQIGNARSDWEVIDAESGEIKTLPPGQFRNLYVLSWELPSHMRAIVDKAPSWREWQAARTRGTA